MKLVFIILFQHWKQDQIFHYKTTWPECSSLSAFLTPHTVLSASHSSSLRKCSVTFSTTQTTVWRCCEFLIRPDDNFIFCKLEKAWGANAPNLNNKELERKWRDQVGVLFTDQNTEETYSFPWKIFLESKHSKFFPLLSNFLDILWQNLYHKSAEHQTEWMWKVCKMGVLCSVRIWTQSLNVCQVQSKISLRCTCMHTFWPHPTASAESQQTCLPPATC